MGLSRARAAVYTPSPRLYRCGDCPCCSFMGDLVLLKARWSDSVFVYCPSCGLAFDAPPQGIDSIQTPEDFAPEGYLLADADDIGRAVREGWSPTDEGPIDEWWTEFLGPGLHRR
jgi:hypothetical protein